MITAAHVLDAFYATGSLYYYIGPRVTRRVVGRALMTPNPAGRNMDQQDIGVVELTGDALPPYADIEKLCVELHNLRPRAMPRESATYIVLGFPSTKNELHRVRRELVAKVYAFHGHAASEPVYEALQLTEPTHLLIKFDPKAGKGAENKPVHFPKPQGMSGGPVFRIPLVPDRETYKGFPVVAIAIAHQTAQKAIQCTDISVAIDIIGAMLAMRVAD